MSVSLMHNSPIKCLIIDDDIFSAKIVQKFITDTNILELVGIANGGIEAARILRDTTVDVLFLDIEMPVS